MVSAALAQVDRSLFHDACRSARQISQPGVLFPSLKNSRILSPALKKIMSGKVLAQIPYYQLVSWVWGIPSGHRGKKFFQFQMCQSYQRLGFRQSLLHTTDQQSSHVGDCMENGLAGFQVQGKGLCLVLFTVFFLDLRALPALKEDAWHWTILDCGLNVV